MFSSAAQAVVTAPMAEDDSEGWQTKGSTRKAKKKKKKDDGKEEKKKKKKGEREGQRWR